MLTYPKLISKNGCFFLTTIDVDLMLHSNKRPRVYDYINNYTIFKYKRMLKTLCHSRKHQFCLGKKK